MRGGVSVVFSRRDADGAGMLERAEAFREERVIAVQSSLDCDEKIVAGS